MASILKNVLRFEGLVVDTPSSQPHLLNVNGLAAEPKLVFPNASGFTITADSTDVTVTRLSGSPDTVDVYVEKWHSYEDAEPIPPIPYVPFIGGGGSSGGGSSANYVTAQSSAPQALANNTANQEVLQTDDLQGEVGSVNRISGMVAYKNVGNTGSSSLVTVLLKEDGVTIATFADTATGVDNDGVFDMNSVIAFNWFVNVVDTVAHGYTVDITTDSGSDGTQTIESGSLFVENLPAAA